VSDDDDNETSSTKLMQQPALGPVVYRTEHFTMHFRENIQRSEITSQRERSHRQQATLVVADKQLIIGRSCKRSQ
jgi:hypothetical protein